MMDEDPAEERESRQADQKSRSSLEPGFVPKHVPFSFTVSRKTSRNPCRLSVYLRTAGCRYIRKGSRGRAISACGRVSLMAVASRSGATMAGAMRIEPTIFLDPFSPCSAEADHVPGAREVWAVSA